MARFSSFLGSAKPVSAAVVNVLTFTGNDLPSAGVIAYHGVFAGSGNNVTDITRIRVKADNQLIYDTNLLHFQKWSERFSAKGYAQPGAAARFTIPFNLVDVVDDDAADMCQFPRGAVPTVEITTASTVVAGQLLMGWTQTTVDPMLFPTLLGQPLNIGVSQTNAQFPVNDRGALRGMMINTAGLARLKCVLNGMTWHELSGVDYPGGATAYGDMLLESQAFEDGAGASGTAVVTTAAALRLPDQIPSGGASFLQLDTSASWGGVSNEATFWALRNQN